MYISVADITFVVLPELTPLALFYSFFFFNDTATTEIYTLSLHDALPICFETTQSRPPRHPRGFRPEWPRRQRRSARRFPQNSPSTAQKREPCQTLPAPKCYGRPTGRANLPQTRRRLGDKAKPIPRCCRAGAPWRCQGSPGLARSCWIARPLARDLESAMRSAEQTCDAIRRCTRRRRQIAPACAEQEPGMRRGTRLAGFQTR